MLLVYMFFKLLNIFKLQLILRLLNYFSVRVLVTVTDIFSVKVTVRIRISSLNFDDLTAGVGVSYDPLSHTRHNGEV